MTKNKLEIKKKYHLLSALKKKYRENMLKHWVKNCKCIKCEYLIREKANKKAHIEEIKPLNLKSFFETKKKEKKFKPQNTKAKT